MDEQAERVRMCVRRGAVRKLPEAWLRTCTHLQCEQQCSAIVSVVASSCNNRNRKAYWKRVHKIIINDRNDFVNSVKSIFLKKHAIILNKKYVPNVLCSNVR
jgi:hypothetical protein